MYCGLQFIFASFIHHLFSFLFISFCSIPMPYLCNLCIVTWQCSNQKSKKEASPKMNPKTQREIKAVQTRITMEKRNSTLREKVCPKDWLNIMTCEGVQVCFAIIYCMQYFLNKFKWKSKSKMKYCTIITRFSPKFIRNQKGTTTNKLNKRVQVVIPQQFQRAI